MSLFSDNIRQLRVKRYLSGKLAQKSLITRGRYVKYEDGSSEPPYDILKRMSYYFHVSIDILLG
jgi:transcriptional regulator with XRE-family HTH domain